MLPRCFTDDQLELLESLNRHGVEFVLVGGVAVNYHGHARTTGDVDFFYRRTAENAVRLYEALRDFFGGAVPVIGGASSLEQPGLVLQFGVPPFRVDFINELSGVEFEEVWANRLTETLESTGIELSIIDIERLLQNKRAAGRAKDQDDVEYLRDLQDENQ